MYFIAPKTIVQSNNMLAYNLKLRAYHLAQIQKTNKLQNSKIFIAYYIDKVRLIDNF